MFFSAKDAKKKSCPFARIASWTKCYGEQCAAWRWKDGENFTFHIKWCPVTHTRIEPQRPAGIETYEFVPFDGETEAHWREPRAEALARREGYCGMAVKP